MTNDNTPDQSAPIRSPGSVMALAPRAAAPAPLLVIDDDEDLPRMLRRGLAFAGYTVRMAADGETGLCLALEAERAWA